MKTERELKLEVALQKIVDATPANKPGEWHHHHWYLVTAREALVGEDAGGGDERYVTCPSCEGSGLRLNSAGEPDECVDCGGNTVVPDAPPQRRDAPEALDLAIKHIRGKGDKFSERNPTAVLSQLEGTRSRISHALANPAPPTVPEAVRRLPDEWREQCGTMDNMSRVGMAAADQRRECADELDRAIEQNEEEAERLRSILYPTEEL